jgi:probable phosphoglycerate mutase
MRHAEVSYFGEDGAPVNPAEVPLTEEGVAQARTVAAAFADVELDRVVTSGLPRTLETAGIVAPGHELERWPELQEIRGAVSPFSHRRAQSVPIEILVQMCRRTEE